MKGDAVGHDDLSLLRIQKTSGAGASIVYASKRVPAALLQFEGIDTEGF